MTVVDLRKAPHTHYIGRPSVFGNPFIIGRDGTREEVIGKYRAWLPEQHKVVNAIMDLPEDAILGCFCKPKACHGDVIVEVWNWRERLRLLAKAQRESKQ